MKHSSDQLKVYEPNYIVNAGLHVWADMFKELVGFRGLVWRLIIRDISARYKQSLFGVFWAFIAPMVLMMVFVWVKNRQILPIDDTAMPYAAFVFTGQMIWQLFSQGVLSSANSLVAAGNMLTKINFPREVLIFSAIGQTVFDFILKIPLLFIVFYATGFLPGFSIVLIPFALLPMLIMIIGIGFFVSLLNAVSRDVANALSIIMNLGMFLTPVIYPPPESWPFSFLINTLNPVSSFISISRDLMTTGIISDPFNYVFSLLFSLLIFLFGWRLFHLTEPKIAERI
ncbi:ABC transporter permease [Thermodesulfobacteriota bacterium]